MSDDLISRQAAIEMVDNYADDIYNSTAKEIKQELINLPSIQPQEKTGKWEIAIGYDIERTVMCDQCRKMAYEPSNYCPYCGAKMEG